VQDTWDVSVGARMARDSIRATLGWLLDYRRLIADANLRLTVVIQEKLNDDLVALCD